MMPFVPSLILTQLSYSNKPPFNYFPLPHFNAYQRHSSENTFHSTTKITFQMSCNVTFFSILVATKSTFHNCFSLTRSRLDSPDWRLFVSPLCPPVSLGTPHHKILTVFVTNRLLLWRNFTTLHVIKDIGFVSYDRVKEMIYCFRSQKIWNCFFSSIMDSGNKNSLHIIFLQQIWLVSLSCYYFYCIRIRF